MPVRLTLALLLLALALLASGSCAPKVPKGGAGIEVPSGIPRQDFARAIALQRDGKHVRSVPYFRAAAAGDPNVAQLHIELAQALHNASIEMDFSGRAVRYVLARSQDRARARAEALFEASRGIELATDDQELAYAWFVRTRILDMSGDVAGALLSIERGLEVRPTEAMLVRTKLALEARLRPAR